MASCRMVAPVAPNSARMRSPYERFFTCAANLQRGGSGAGGTLGQRGAGRAATAQAVARGSRSWCSAVKSSSQLVATRHAAWECTPAHNNH